MVPAAAALWTELMSSFSHVRIEQVREFWDRRPCNLRHSPQPPGTRAYFDEVEARKYLVERHIPAFAQFERWRGKRVLEIGCGIGTDTVSFARQGAQVTAVELSPKSLEIAACRMQVFGLQDHVRFLLGSAEELHRFLPEETYDLIYSFGVIHHTPQPERILQQMRRYAAPGTTVKIMIYHRYSTKVLGVILRQGQGRFWRASELVARYSEAQTGCPITYTYSKSQARALLEENGFRVTDMFADHIFPYRVADYVQYRYVKAWPWSWMPDPVFRRLERHWGWHLCLTAEAAA